MTEDDMNSDESIEAARIVAEPFRDLIEAGTGALNKVTGKNRSPSLQMGFLIGSIADAIEAAKTPQKPFHSLSRNEDTSAVRPDQTGDEK